MGTSGIYARPNVEDVDIGFAMLPDYMGKGYSYEAASKLMELAKAEFGLKKITALTTRNDLQLLQSQCLVQVRIVEHRFITKKPPKIFILRS